MNIVDKAYNIAKKAHAGQFRRDGKTPYLTHPVAVANSFHWFFPSEKILNLKAISLLHDVLEDNTKWTEKRLLQNGIPQEIVDAVILLTKSDDLNYLGYLLKLKENDLARSVKMADISDNLKTSKGNQKDKYILAMYILRGN